MDRRLTIIVLLFVVLPVFSCAPVLSPDIMKKATTDFSLQELKKTPDAYRGTLYVFGGVIVSTKGTPDGSLIEGIFVPVNSRGYLRDYSSSRGRFLALFPRESGFLDPEVFSRNRDVTIAGEFAGLREGKIDDMVYEYPFFVIREIYLWREETYYSYPYSYYPYYPRYYDPYPYWWDSPYRGARPWIWRHPYWRY
jgi:outer membrane lipoprotein